MVGAALAIILLFVVIAILFISLFARENSTARKAKKLATHAEMTRNLVSELYSAMNDEASADGGEQKAKDAIERFLNMSPRFNL